MSAYDYIVVGGGSAGCVTAGTLVREHGARVLLLEAGGRDWHPFIHAPAGYARLLRRPRRGFTLHQSEPQRALGERRVPLIQARVLGGGSSINAMTYTRGTRADYARWAAATGDAGWGWDGMLPHFVRQEANQRLGAPDHGVAGPLTVSDPHHPVTDLSRAFILSLQAMGVPYSADINSGDERGVTVVQSTTDHGRRCSAVHAFIRPLRADPRLTVRTRSSVLRVLFDRTRATGVEVAAGGSGGVERIYGGEVVLAAGSYVTPKILLLSGVGSSAELAPLGIRTIADLPGVGRNLQDHNGARFTAITRGDHGFSGADRGWAMLANVLQYALLGSGPAASTGSEVTAFVNPLDPAAEPTVQFYCLGKILPAPGDRSRPPVGATLIANLVAPQSRGSVTLRSADPADPPTIDLGWLGCEHDWAHLTAGLNMLRDLCGVAPLARLIERVRDLPEGDEDALRRYIGSVTSTNWHPVGTCAMGRDDDPLAVLDPQLRVRGVERLRVFDASMMPSIVSANTNAPVMAVADRGVALMTGSGGDSPQRGGGQPAHPSP